MDKFVITIGREYGSGGRIIAQKLAEEFGIKFFDKELITMTAKESGFSEVFIKQTEQKKTSSFLYNLCVSSNALPVSDQIFIAQSETIKHVSANESCIIVGRCADYVLRETDNCLNIFVHAPLEDRLERAKAEYNVGDANIQAVVIKTDKDRAAYYNHFTPYKWGNPRNYHLCINSSVGIDNSVALIKELALRKFGGLK